MGLNNHFPWEYILRDLPGGPVAETGLSVQGVWVRSPGQGTRSHMLQLGVRIPKVKIPHVTTRLKILSVATKT